MSAPAPRVPPAGKGRAVAGRRSRDGAATRQRIEAEALRLFAEKGVAATSVRDIAQASGLSEGALYRHFRSKEALARDLFLSRYAALAGEICAIDDAVPDLAAKLSAIVGLTCRLFDREPALFAYLLIHQHEHLRAVPDTAEANVVEAVARLLRRAGLSPDRATLASAMALGCVVQPAVFALYGRLIGPLGDRAEEIVRAVTGIIEAVRGA